MAPLPTTAKNHRAHVVVVRNYKSLAPLVVVMVYCCILLGDRVASFYAGQYGFSTKIPTMGYKPFEKVTFPRRQNNDGNCNVPSFAEVVHTKTVPSFRIAIYKNHGHSGGIVSMQIKKYGGWEKELWPYMTQSLGSPLSSSRAWSALSPWSVT